MQDDILSYIDDTDDAIEEHVNFLTGKNLHEVWPGNNCLTNFQFVQVQNTSNLTDHRRSLYPLHFSSSLERSIYRGLYV